MTGMPGAIVSASGTRRMPGSGLTGMPGAIVSSSGTRIIPGPACRITACAKADPKDTAAHTRR